MSDSAEETAGPVVEAEFHVEVGTREPFKLHAQLLLREQGVLVLFGPSGCGKSLTLQAVVGVVRPRSGYLRVGGEVLFDSERDVWIPPHRRRIGYVPQHHALFPFCNVYDNIAFGLPRSERRSSERVDRLIEELHIQELRHVMPAGLSGGERQRVALARALAMQPRLLVLDEPFAALDIAGRNELQQLLRKTLEQHRIPALFVTHDPAEALTLGDALVRFERGRTTGSGPCATMLTDLLEQQERLAERLKGHLVDK